MAQKPGPPLFWSDKRVEEWIRKVAQVVLQLQKGQANNSFTVLLEENTTTTEVLVSFARANQIVLFSPQDSATAVVLGNGTLWAEATRGKIVIHHVSTTGERKIGACLFG